MEEWLSQENVYDSEGQRIHRYDTKIYVMPNEGGGEPAYSECEARDYIYQNGSLLSTEDISNSYTYFNLLTPGGNLIASSRPDEENNEKWYLYNKDDQGSTTSIIGEDGSAAAVYDYDEYGNTEVISGADFDNEIRYTGQMCDKSTGLYYYNARFYDPASGIFTSQDTYRGENSNPLTQNLYAYCAGDPVNNIDPTGHSWIGKKWKSFKAAVKKATKRSRTLNGSWSDHKTKKTVSGNPKHLNKKTKKYRKSLWKVIKRKTKAFTRIIKNKKKDSDVKLRAKPLKKKEILNFSVEAGAGLGAGISAGAIKGKLLWKNTVLWETSDPSTGKINGEGGIYIGTSNKLLVGTGYRLMAKDNPKKPGWLKTEISDYYVGLRMGEYSLGKFNVKEKDTVIDIGGDVYAGIGGSATIEINVSEIWRRMKGKRL